jgi:glycerol transport system ATP-binding protein
VRFNDTVLPLSPALNRRIAELGGQRLKVGIRPEFVHIWDGPNDDALCGDVVHLEDLGTYKILSLKLDGQLLKVRLQEDQPVPQQRVYLSFPAQWLMLYADDFLVETQAPEVQP